MNTKGSTSHKRSEHTLTMGFKAYPVVGASLALSWHAAETVQHHRVAAAQLQYVSNSS